MPHPQEQAVQAADQQPQAVQGQRQRLRAAAQVRQLLLTVRAGQTHWLPLELL